jgi:hypothetical protein
MYDSGKIIGGLVIFLGLVTFPFWFSLASGSESIEPQPEIRKGLKPCVESKEYMKAWHMDMLDDWRDEVVRNGKRMYVNSKGQKHPMSLSTNCMKCHDNKVKFCDECHNYVGVDPYCFDCHIEPKGE